MGEQLIVDLRRAAGTIEDAALRLNHLEAVEKWAVESLNLGYKVGDVVHIVKPYTDLDQSSGWWAYREMLSVPRAAQGTVTKIDFNAYHGYWYAAVRFDTGWSLSSGVGDRVYLFSHPKVFMVGAKRLRKVKKRDRVEINIRNSQPEFEPDENDCG